MRTEQEVFDELALLCSSPGYAHALAYFAFRDNTIWVADKLDESSMAPMFSGTRLLRTEQATLMGLLLRGHLLDISLPPPRLLNEYISRTYALLDQLHETVAMPMKGRGPHGGTAREDPFSRGDVLREPIFYGGESAYSFQYRDLSVRRYATDNEWLETNLGFSIETARDVISAVQREVEDRGSTVLDRLDALPKDEWSFLPCFLFRPGDIAARAQLPKAAVGKVLRAFSAQPSGGNAEFRSLKDFNAATATPLIPVNDDLSFLAFQINGLWEALYMGPYYWMMEDPSYSSTAAIHRGRFAEEFVRDRLEAVFGRRHVSSNVNISRSKRGPVGEIDVLVRYCDRTILVQVKSKQLTLAAKGGDDVKLRRDFAASTQAPYDQALSCSKLLMNSGKYRLTDGDGRPVSLARAPSEIYPLCVVSDHYPARLLQARTFLEYTSTDVIKPPLVLDVFALDAMAEMLSSPLKFLSYLHRRALLGDRVMAHHELTLLACHIKHNLWIDDDIGFVYYDDSVSASLDVAMQVRRTKAPGDITPDGFLKRFDNTTIGEIVKAIERQPEPATLDFGLLMLSLSEDTVRDLSTKVDHIVERTSDDGASHDLTVGFSHLSTGITVHCNSDPIMISVDRLNEHCRRRQYSQRAKTWFGICIDDNLKLRYGMVLRGERSYEIDMEHKVRELSLSDRVDTKISGGSQSRSKLGRNHPCPCGSGRKFKHCCL